MRHKLIVTLVAGAALLGLVAPAGGAGGAAEPRGITPEPQRYLDTLFDTFDRVDDVQYNESFDVDVGGLEPHFADIYTPHDDTETARPLVIWIHGGGFSNGDEDDMSWAAEESVRRGYVAASISYRLREDIEGIEIVQAIRDATLDAQAAVRFFRTNAATYGIDPNLIVVGGYSAGAVTALNVVFNEEIAEVASPSSHVLAAVSMAGAFGGSPEPGDAPIVMFHGTADTTVPYAQGVAQCEAQTAAGNVCEFHSYPGEGHILLDDIDEILLLSHEFLYGYVTCGLPFSDIAPNHVFCGDIDWMATNGISEGYPDGTYRPLNTLTRQAAVAFLWVLGGSLDCDWPEVFSDVPDSHPFATEIGWAAEGGVVGGYADGTFRPGGLVTRQAFVSFLWKMAGSPTGSPNPGFSDIGTGHPFYQPIAWAADHDIVGGYPDDTFRAGATVTRQAAAAFVHRANDDLGAPGVGCPT